MSFLSFKPVLAKVLLTAAVVLIFSSLQSNASASTTSIPSSFPHYTVAYLGGVDSTAGSISTINMLGNGVGSVSNDRGGYDTFLLSQGITDDISSQVGVTSHVTTINDYGTLAGVLTSGNSSYPFTYTSGHFSQLKGPSGSLFDTASINDQNQVVGYIYGPVGGGDYRQDAVLWQPDGSYVDLFLWPGIPSIPPEFEFSYATGINFMGTTVGSANGYAIKWEDGVSYPLPDADGQAAFGSNANGINFFGDIAGTTNNSVGSPVATVWNSDMSVHVLGSLNHMYDQSNAYSINDWGDVVGSSQVSRGTYAFRAFLYHDNKMVNLNNLLPADTDVKLLSARQITDNGQILCLGLRTGYPEVQYILLTPTNTSL